MINIQIASNISEISPNIVLGCIIGEVAVSPSNEALLEIMSQESLKQRYSVDAIANLPRIKETREFYSAGGKDPSRYRGSAEALLRRLAQGKGLYNVNNVVDINNLLSIRSHFSVGSYDLAQLTPPLCFGTGKQGESYKGIGKGVVNIEHLPVFIDEQGPFGSPTSDSERAMIRADTTNLLMIVISFSGRDGISETLDLGMEWLTKFANGRNLNNEIVEGK